MSVTWRSLAVFWVVLVLCGVGGFGVLQVLGPVAGTPAASPPAAEGRDVAADQPRADIKPPVTRVAQPAAPAEAPRPADEPRQAGSPVPGPDAALLEPAPHYPGAFLPRIGRVASGAAMSPMKAYAGGFDPHDPRPRVALLLAGLGLSSANSEDAIRTTPAGVTLAFSPYAVSPDVTQARARGHEVVLSIPMEPAGYPLEDEGPQSLLTSSTADANQLRLEWILSRIEGYAGTTGALGDLRGERFARSEEQISRVVSGLVARGLYYIDPQVGDTAPRGGSRTVDLVIDDMSLSQSIDVNLDALTRLAVDRGAALGLVGSPRPVTVSRIAAWAEGLDGRGVVLVPVSALFVRSPPVQASQAGATR